MAKPNSSSKWKGFLRHTRKDGVVTIEPTKSSSGRKVKPDCVSRQRWSFTEKYRPLKITLGEGNAGRVFVAVRRADGQSVAVKRFKQRQAPESEDNYVGKILAEFGVASQLRHRNICQNLELVRDDDGQWYQVMEYAPLDLFDRVCSKRMSQREIDCTFMQLVAGLSYLHQSGIAHRDIKLENVVYTESGVMKIIDFGVATSCNGDNDRQKRLVDDLAGSRPYMAPEMIYRRPYNPQSTDVWSLAIVYCCMVMRRFPWQEASFQDPDFAQFAAWSASTHQSQTKRQSDIVDTQVSYNAAAEISPDRQWEHTVQLSEKTPICDVVEVTPSQEIDGTSDLPSWKPSQLFSEESWTVLGGMLQLDSQKRATMQQIGNSFWVRKSRVCSGRQDDRACTHTHV